MKVKTLATPLLFSWERDTEVPLLLREDHEVLVTLSRVLEQYKPNALINILPSLWQLEPLISDTCKKVKVPLMSIQRENIPLALKTYELLGAESIVGTQEGLHEFFEYAASKKKKVSMQCVVLFASLDEAVTLPMHHDIYIERQLTPGRTCLYQCSHIVPNASEYHLQNGFSFAVHVDHIVVTDIEKELPSKRYDIRIQDTGETCACGERILRYQK